MAAGAPRRLRGRRDGCGGVAMAAGAPRRLRGRRDGCGGVAMAAVPRRPHHLLQDRSPADCRGGFMSIVGTV